MSEDGEFTENSDREERSGQSFFFVFFFFLNFDVLCIGGGGERISRPNEEYQVGKSEEGIGKGMGTSPPINSK